MKYVCANCEFSGGLEEFDPAKDLSMRLARGDTYTDIECPECGALAFPEENPKRKAYLCPNCKADQVQGKSIDIRGVFEAHQDCLCLACGASWTDIYTLIRYEGLEVPEKETAK